MAALQACRPPLPIALAVLFVVLALGPAAHPLLGHSGRTSGGAGYADLPAYEDIDVVHVVFTSHLDIGWTHSATQVINTYFQQFFPQALHTASELEKIGIKNYSFTTYPWLLSLYLDCPANLTTPSTSTCPWGESTLICPTPGEQETIKKALKNGVITWHGHPLDHFPELMDPSLYKFGLSLSQDLDVKYHGGKPTLTASNRDVPGMTRGVIPLLLKAGIRALSVGTNSGVVSPALPPVFWWRAPDSAEKLLVYWHPGGYGGIRQGDAVVVPGFKEALVSVYGGDNTGYVTVQDVLQTFAILRSEFPNAKIIPSTFDAFTEKLLANQTALDTLPVIDQEIGDTWIYGEAADPWKIAVYREMTRARAEYLAKGGAEDEAVKRFSRFLLKIPEHTTGINFTNYPLPQPSWSNPDFQKNASNCQFQWIQYSWDEQRMFLQWALNFLGKDHPLAIDIRARIKAMQPLQSAAAGTAPLPVEQWDQPLECGQWSLRFDQHGAIVSLIDKAAGRREWASPDHPLALLRYETFGPDNFAYFADRYSYDLPPDSWFTGAWGKPGLTAPPAARKSATPLLFGLWRIDDTASCRFLLETRLPPPTVTDFGAPPTLWTELKVPRSGSALKLDLQWLNKTSTRLPETIWLDFQPKPATDEGWSFCKLGQAIDPRQVVINGNRHLHGVWDGVSFCSPTDGSFFLQTLDAPLISPGRHEILDFDNDRAKPGDGVQVNLFNNLWGNDFPQWYPWTDTPPASPSISPDLLGNPANARFRFELRFGDSCPKPSPCSAQR
ncbi:MAG TPA: DUF5054 domain-containing protein [Thermoanaerobaculia bacterium]|jgi:hypothetical protein|nr:DUF5054 domain-containing protein [Thermoanaerobaculia bacterium]